MKKLLLIINLFEGSFYITSLFVVGFTIADIIVSKNTTFFSNLLSLMCHQKPDSCCVVFNQHMELCARCFGIYLGTIIFYRNINYLKRYLYLYYFSIIYLFINLFMELYFKINGTNFTRFLFGVVFSFCVLWSTSLISYFAVNKITGRDLQLRENELRREI